MKQILLPCAILVAGLVSMAASCHSEADEVQPDNFQSLVGKWQLERFEGKFTQPDGSVKNVAWNTEDMKIKLIWELKNNGEFIGSTGSESHKGQWKLQVMKTDGLDITEGQLTLFGFPEAAAMAEILGTEQMTFKVRTTNVPYGKTNSISLVTEVDASKERDGLATILIYRYAKL